MKRIYLLALAALGTTVAFSQTTKTKTDWNEVQVGLRGSANFATFKGNTQVSNTATGRTTVHADHETTWSAGFFVNIPLGTKALTLEPAVEYARKGAEMEDVAGTQADFKQKISYVDVPLVLRVGVGKAFNVYAGPQMSFLLKTDTEASGTGSSAYTVVSQNRSDYRNQVLGGRAGVQFSAHHIGIFGQYQTDLQDTFKAHVNSNRRNQMWQLGLSYIF